MKTIEDNAGTLGLAILFILVLAGVFAYNRDPSVFLDFIAQVQL